MNLENNNEIKFMKIKCDLSHINKIRKNIVSLTDHIQQSENFTEVVPVSPPIVKPKIFP